MMSSSPQYCLQCSAISSEIFAATFYSVYYIICTSGNVKSIKRFVGVGMCVREKNVVKVIILLLVVQAVD